MSNDITTLREHLFETLRALRDKESPMEVERARAISEVAQTVINTAKVELDFLKHSGADKSHFVPEPDAMPRLPRSPAPTPMPTADSLPPVPPAEDGEVRHTRTGTIIRDHAAGVTRHTTG